VTYVAITSHHSWRPAPGIVHDIDDHGGIIVHLIQLVTVGERAVHDLAVGVRRLGAAVVVVVVVPDGAGPSRAEVNRQRFAGQTRGVVVDERDGVGVATLLGGERAADRVVGERVDRLVAHRAAQPILALLQPIGHVEHVGNRVAVLIGVDARAMRAVVGILDDLIVVIARRGHRVMARIRRHDLQIPRVVFVHGGVGPEDAGLGVDVFDLNHVGVVIVGIAGLAAVAVLDLDPSIARVVGDQRVVVLGVLSFDDVVVVIVDRLGDVALGVGALAHMYLSPFPAPNAQRASPFR